MYVNGIRKTVNVYVHREINVVFLTDFDNQIGQPGWDHFGLPTCWYHNFVSNGPILTILVPIKSPYPWLSIGTKMVKVGTLLTKLWPCKVNHHFVKHFSSLCTGFRTYVKTAYLHINSHRFFVHKEKRATLVSHPS